jgi:hypothetical protein
MHGSMNITFLIALIEILLRVMEKFFLLERRYGIIEIKLNLLDEGHITLH